MQVFFLFFFSEASSMGKAFRTNYLFSTQKTKIYDKKQNPLILTKQQHYDLLNISVCKNMKFELKSKTKTKTKKKTK